MLNSQVEYHKFYDSLRAYAKSKAYKLFPDLGMRLEAIDKAVTKAEDEILKNPNHENLEGFARTIIQNSLKNSTRDRKINLVSTEDTLTQEGRRVLGDATKVKQIVYKGTYPKVNIVTIKDKKERRICLDYWQYGYKQDEIATKVKVTQQYVSQVILKYSK
jgi:DNA-directed RNA polymerase specialized sigma subunit